MTDRAKLPAKTTMGHLVLPKDQSGSLVARGLEALREEIKPDVLLEPIDIVAKYRKSAEQGDAEAQLNLGWEYWTGEFIPRDIAKALEWWHKSADQGCTAAQNSLGWAYSIEGEYVTAYFWLGLAQDSISDVGPKVIYNSYYTDPYHIEFFIEELRSRRSNDERSELRAKGHALGLTPIEIAREIEALVSPAEIAEAEYSIGVAYHEGDGVPQNDDQAIRWWSRAAERGYEDAMYFLGCIYADVDSVHNDYIKAYMWFSITNKSGRTLWNPSSDGQIWYLEPDMTPEEIVEAERLASEWIEAHAS